MKIGGANLEEKEVEFKNLTEFAELGSDFYKVMEFLQNLYYSSCDKVSEMKINSFPIEENKVIIKPMMINHRCRDDIEMLEGISKYGIIASEWFGILESEQEGRFCTFVDRIKPDSFPLAENVNFRRLNDSSENVILFFDQENEVMKNLLRLDFFEYQRIKRDEPEKLNDLFSKDELVLLDCINYFSKASFDFHDSDTREYYYWSAIPGGIPALLVNGICVKNNNYPDEYIERLSDLFPNAVIFDGMLNIVCKSKNNIDDVHIK